MGKEKDKTAEAGPGWEILGLGITQHPEAWTGQEVLESGLSYSLGQQKSCEAQKQSRETSGFVSIRRGENPKQNLPLGWLNAEAKR